MADLPPRTAVFMVATAGLARGSVSWALSFPSRKSRPSGYRAADRARRRRHGARQPDDPVAHRLRRHDDPGGRQSSDLLRRQAVAADPDAGDGGPVRLSRATATSSSPPRSNSCTRRRCCTTTSSIESDMRRGKRAARMLWGNEASVLVGDFLLGQAFKMMVEVGSLHCLDVLSTAAAVIAEGEVMQLSAAKDTADDRGRLSRRHPRQDGGAVRRRLRGRPDSRRRAPRPRSPPAAATAPISASPSSSSTTRSTTAARRPSSARTSATISARARSRCRSCCRSGAARRRSASSGGARWSAARSRDGDLEIALATMKKHRALEDTIERARHYGAMARDALELFPPSPWKHALLRRRGVRGAAGALRREGRAALIETACCE